MGAGSMMSPLSCDDDDDDHGINQDDDDDYVINHDGDNDYNSQNSKDDFRKLAGAHQSRRCN